ncbi:cupin 2 conserved barrel domain protein [Leptolyngbya sp. Heron Island J]|uniref:cupin domain-containing protein n=1 Tax=Leptolyngbya sp. Heron Island J TaxID=1385935 RepID=UPI0003B96548|nr:cupin domain-containing protein [Leptolyngbya sp. Heron Island J]ESA32016.1 cupin 2 conserved barrel domain protein [Leptolyngbya sp. Heron Island J]
MVATLASPPTTSIHLPDLIQYPASGVYSRILARDAVCRSSLFCLTAGTEIDKHTAPHNATIHIVEGAGKLTFQNEARFLEAGRFITVPAQIPYAIKALSNMTFVLTHSVNI